ncbi:hypothetical protein FRC03_009085 [Tulasnella sp. 419]|nr:hypothetical protein FRC02_008774 [Tulasnella sp. 418]KAG8958500.1 hypothetical protein FRC03_009085 [Tulasnella sp. 419]
MALIHAAGPIWTTLHKPEKAKENTSTKTSRKEITKLLKPQPKVVGKKVASAIKKLKSKVQGMSWSSVITKKNQEYPFLNDVENDPLKSSKLTKLTEIIKDIMKEDEQKDPSDRQKILVYCPFPSMEPMIKSDHEWSGLLRRQIVGRCWREGQLRLVFVHTIFARDTVDENMQALADQKEAFLCSLTGEDAVMALGTDPITLINQFLDDSDDEEDSFQRLRSQRSHAQDLGSSKSAPIVISDDEDSTPFPSNSNSLRQSAVHISKSVAITPSDDEDTSPSSPRMHSPSQGAVKPSMQASHRPKPRRKIQGSSDPNSDYSEEFFFGSQAHSKLRPGNRSNGNSQAEQMNPSIGAKSSSMRLRSPLVSHSSPEVTDCEILPFQDDMDVEESFDELGTQDKMMEGISVRTAKIQVTNVDDDIEMSEVEHSLFGDDEEQDIGSEYDEEAPEQMNSSGSKSGIGTFEDDLVAQDDERVDDRHEEAKSHSFGSELFQCDHINDNNPTMPIQIVQKLYSFTPTPNQLDGILADGEETVRLSLPQALMRHFDYLIYHKLKMPILWSYKKELFWEYPQFWNEKTLKQLDLDGKSWKKTVRNDPQCHMVAQTLFYSGHIEDKSGIRGSFPYRTKARNITDPRTQEKTSVDMFDGEIEWELLNAALTDEVQDLNLRSKVPSKIRLHFDFQLVLHYLRKYYNFAKNGERLSSLWKQGLRDLPVSYLPYRGNVECRRLCLSLADNLFLESIFNQGGTGWSPSNLHIIRNALILHQSQEASNQKGLFNGPLGPSIHSQHQMEKFAFKLLKPYTDWYLETPIEEGLWRYDPNALVIQSIDLNGATQPTGVSWQAFSFTQLLSVFLCSKKTQR